MKSALAPVVLVGLALSCVTPDSNGKNSGTMSRPPKRPSAFGDQDRGFSSGIDERETITSPPESSSSPSTEFEPVKPPSSAPADPPPLSDLVRAADLEAHVRFLASDELEGRATGSAGSLAAADYLAEQLAAVGIVPAGDDGSYFQRVPITTVDYGGPPKIIGTRKDGSTVEYVYGIHFNQLSGLPPAKELPIHRISGQLDAPHEARPDLAIFVDGTRRQRERWVDDELDWGMLIRPASPRDGPRPTTSAPPSMRWVGDPPPLGPRFGARGTMRLALETDLLEKLWIEVDARQTDVQAHNVVGILPGRGTLADEVVVYTAHYDHVGTVDEPSEPGADVVYNGADDDASGCAAVLELAEALAVDARDHPDRPTRTQIFLFVTAEEIGLLGTEWYLDHPVRPLESTVCNLNLEMTGRPDDLVGGPGTLWLTGDELTTLGQAFRKLELPIVADPRPEQQFFKRSDNYAFAKRGVVAQTLSSYNLHQDYHRVTDEAETLDYRHMETTTRGVLEAARALAHGEISPRWLPGAKP